MNVLLSYHREPVLSADVALEPLALSFEHISLRRFHLFLSAADAAIKITVMVSSAM